MHTVYFPLADEFLTALPATNIKRLADIFPEQCSFNGKWTATGAMFAALLPVLTGGQMSSKNSEHGSTVKRVTHAVHTQLSLVLQTIDIKRDISGGGGQDRTADLRVMNPSL